MASREALKVLGLWGEGDSAPYTPPASADQSGLRRRPVPDRSAPAGAFHDTAADARDNADTAGAAEAVEVTDDKGATGHLQLLQTDAGARSARPEGGAASPEDLAPRRGPPPLPPLHARLPDPDERVDFGVLLQRTHRLPAAPSMPEASGADRSAGRRVAALLGASVAGLALLLLGAWLGVTYEGVASEHGQARSEASPSADPSQGLVRLAPIRIKPSSGMAAPNAETMEFTMQSAWGGDVGPGESAESAADEAHGPKAGADPEPELASAEQPKPRSRTASRRAVQSAAPSLPRTPSRSEVREALQALQADVRSCAEQWDGQTVPVNVTVASSGRVTTARVTGTLAGTRAGSCIARTVRKARFPEFRKDFFEVRYPFQL